MEPWLKAALGYIPQWLGHQMRLAEQPGAVLAIAHRGRLVFEQAFGQADITKDIALSPRHRFRVASHSKSFTAAGILKLREQGRLGLDDPAGRHVKGLHPAVAKATIAQLLSHSAGIIRDGTDSGQWLDRRAFLERSGSCAQPWPRRRSSTPIPDSNIPTTASDLPVSSSRR